MHIPAIPLEPTSGSRSQDRQNALGTSQPAPVSILECNTSIDKLLAEIRTIEGHLAEKNRLSASGKRLSNAQYHAWRKRSLQALNLKLVALRELKAWRTDQHARHLAFSAMVDLQDTEAIVKACFVLQEQLKSMLPDNAITPEMYAIMDAVRNRVIGHPSNHAKP